MKKIPTNIRHICILGMFAALAIGIYGLETLIPNPFPIPGVKLGLANIITLVVLKRYGFKDAGAVLLVRILLSALLFGQFLSLLYSAAGGLLCLIAEYLFNRFLKGHALFLTAVIGSVFHNAGQFIVAILITGVSAVIAYAPYLAISGALTGLFTGLCAYYMLKLLPKQPPSF